MTDKLIWVGLGNLRFLQVNKKLKKLDYSAWPLGLSFNVPAISSASSPIFVYGGPLYVNWINFTIGIGTSCGQQLHRTMAAVVDDGWEDDWQMTASGNGGIGQWQGISGNVEQWRTMAAAARGRGSGWWRHGNRLAADDDAVVVGGRQRWWWRGCVKLVV